MTEENKKLCGNMVGIANGCEGDGDTFDRDIGRFD